MRGKAAQWGNSVAVRLPKEITSRLGLSPGRPVEITSEGSKVIIETRVAERDLPVLDHLSLVAEMEALGGAAYDPGGVPFEDTLSEWPEYNDRP
ncbi:AbrB/MazE/SpoVT family DNA-binding domain-containing protein [Phreatobacter sp.]|uniref:AbrB/MazE/SpoVT family DNA-binding domain-containing protein n=1 Tax=Phreatobacter sp. TaxID=1966341 RepID=UPI003F6E85CD